MSGTRTNSKCYFKELPCANTRDINQMNDEDERSLVQIIDIGTHSEKLKE